MKLMCSSTHNKCDEKRYKEKKMEKNASKHAHTHSSMKRSYADAHLNNCKRGEKKIGLPEETLRLC